MLKKIGQKLAGLKNLFRKKSNIPEQAELSPEEMQADQEALSPFDQLVQNSNQAPAATADKTGEVKVPPLEETVEEKPVAASAPEEIKLETEANTIPPLEETKEEAPPAAPVADADKTPVPKFDTIPPRSPRFESLPTSNNVQFEDGSESSSNPNNIDLDSSQPLYQIPKKSRLPWLTTPLKKVAGIFALMFKGVLSKIKKERPDLFSGAEDGESKLNLNKVYEIIFSPESRGKIHQGFIILLITLTCYAVGKTVALALRGKDNAPIARARPIDLGNTNQEMDLNIIRVANIFNAHDIQDIKKNRSQDNLPCTLADAQSSSSLPIKVLNTIVLQDSVKSLAAVQVRSRPVLMEMREGDKIENLAKLDKIDRLKIVIRNLESNQCEYLSNNAAEGNLRGSIQVMSQQQAKAYTQTKSHPDITNEGNRFQIKKRYLNEKLKDIGLVLTQAKAVKITNPDGSLAFKMTEVDPGGPFASLNVHVDDTITGVNGKKFTSMNEVMDLFGKIKDMSKLSISVIRDGEEQVMEYNFTN